MRRVLARGPGLSRAVAGATRMRVLTSVPGPAAMTLTSATAAIMNQPRNFLGGPSILSSLSLSRLLCRRLRCLDSCVAILRDFDHLLTH